MHVSLHAPFIVPTAHFALPLLVLRATHSRCPMPTSTTPQPSSRRSSVGPAGRRGPQKAHVPYRADDLEQTKKTGIQVPYVDHKSDDFEPFDEVLQQADGRTPARKKRKSHVKAAVVQEDEDDEYGEMSMVTDNSGAFNFVHLTFLN